MPENEKQYYESEAKRKWQKENTVFIGVKLQKSTDKDIIEYIDKQKEADKAFSVAGMFKLALREYMENHK